MRVRWCTKVAMIVSSRAPDGDDTGLKQKHRTAKSQLGLAFLAFLAFMSRFCKNFAGKTAGVCVWIRAFASRFKGLSQGLISQSPFARQGAQTAQRGQRGQASESKHTTPRHDGTTQRTYKVTRCLAAASQVGSAGNMPST